MSTHVIICKTCQLAIGITTQTASDLVPAEGSHVAANGERHEGTETYLLGEAEPLGKDADEKLAWASEQVKAGKGILR